MGLPNFLVNYLKHQDGEETKQNVVPRLNL